MDINNLTKLAELFKQYPFLKDELVKYSDKFAALNNPLAKAVVSQVNLEQVSQTSGLDVNTKRSSQRIRRNACGKEGTPFCGRSAHGT